MVFTKRLELSSAETETSRAETETTNGDKPPPWGVSAGDRDNDNGDRDKKVSEYLNISPPTLCSLASARQHQEKPGRPFIGAPVMGGGSKPDDGELR